MIASLPMYDRPETAAANDRFWSLIRAALGHGPRKLTRPADPWDVWLSPDLLLAQTCGLPFRARLHDKVQLVGTPDYGVTDRPGCYRSVFVVRMGGSRELADYAGQRFAFNDIGSQSGWTAPQVHAAALGFRFTDTMRTGSHAGSAAAVARGRADIAALDAVSWAIMRGLDSGLRRLDEIGRTAAQPGLPLITAPGNDAAALFAAFAAAIDGLVAKDRALLRLKGLVRIPKADYLAMPDAGTS